MFTQVQSSRQSEFLLFFFFLFFFFFSPPLSFVLIYNYCTSFLKPTVRQVNGYRPLYVFKLDKMR